MSLAVSGVVLAAGPSTRFGRLEPKQLLELDGVPLVRRMTLEAVRSRLSQVIVVVGWQAERVRQAIADLPVEVVDNRDFEQGQSTSVRMGLGAVAAVSSAALFMPIDQPRLDADLIDRLRDVYRRSAARIVVPCHDGHRGAPVLFDRSLFGELERIEGDAGGRQLFAAHANELVELPLASADPLVDIDSPRDLEGFEGFEG